MHPKNLAVTVCRSAKEVIHYSFSQQGKTVMATSYCKEINCVHKDLKKKQHRLVGIKMAQFCSTTIYVITVLRLRSESCKTWIKEILQHPSYSLDISPADHHLFKYFEPFISNKTVLNKEVIKVFCQFYHSERWIFFYKSEIYDLEKIWVNILNEHGSYFDWIKFLKHPIVTFKIWHFMWNNLIL